MTLAFHLGLLQDARRLETWAAAIEHAVSPDDIVVDLGAGLGALSILAARRGADVLAVEREEVAAHILTFAAHHGVADRITVLTGDSTTLEPPRRGTLAFFDDFDVLDLGGSAVRTLRDARARWLKDDARLLPACVSVCAALVDQRVALPAEVAGLKTAGLGQLHLGPQKRKLTNADALVTSTLVLATGTPDQLGAQGLRLEGTTSATHQAQAAGLLLWPVLDFGATVLDAGPHPSPVAYPQIFFPFAAPLLLERGASCALCLEQVSAAASEGHHRFWRWEAASGDQRARGSTFANGGLDALLADLRRR